MTSAARSATVKQLQAKKVCSHRFAFGRCEKCGIKEFKGPVPKGLEQILQAKEKPSDKSKEKANPKFKEKANEKPKEKPHAGRSDTVPDREGKSYGEQTVDELYMSMNLVRPQSPSL